MGKASPGRAPERMPPHEPVFFSVYEYREEGAEVEPVFGIDVSKWQGDYDFKEAARQGARFCVVRAGGSHVDGGCYRDPNFTVNLNKARAEKMEVGVYWYSNALDIRQIVIEADFLADILEGERLELPVYLDIETLQQASTSRRRLNTAMALAWCATLLSRGFLGGVYSFASFFTDCLDTRFLEGIPLWVASYTYNPPDAAGITMWQFGGNVNYIRDPEIGGVVTDQNYKYINWMPHLRSFSLNNITGYVESIREIALEVLDGKWGNGNERKSALESAGYDYASVQAEVNRILQGRS